MSEPIKVGDLVAVVKPARCCNSFLGAHFTVTAIRSAVPGTEWRCPACSAHGWITVAYVVADGHPSSSISFGRLKRIPPLSDLEGEKQKEDLREPA